jgi:hypothetical protein
MSFYSNPETGIPDADIFWMRIPFYVIFLQKSCILPLFLHCGLASLRESSLEFSSRQDAKTQRKIRVAAAKNNA